MKKILFLLILSLSCNSKPELVIDDNGEKHNSEPEQSSDFSTRSFNKYQYSNDSIVQLIEVDFVIKKELTFKFTQKNKLNNQHFSIQGVAKLSSGSEIDEDETGLSYQVEEFVSEADYGTIYIRVGRNSDREKIRIIQVEYDGANIIYDIGILRNIAFRKTEEQVN